ncbi:hypothetical protein PR002_g11484 [Phytophthora rubi]|uniref:Peptidase S59 domain-containing protein n=1 Tax=Phytophthora rubi TaxID=129364 RepID=A0A6A3LX40_9STRA|nr:hypothetical protein PR002_g11484 [Phytophthora rubi]
MSLFGSSGNGGGFSFGASSFGAHASSVGFGPSGSNTGGFGFGPVSSGAFVSFADADDASEPFGRVESTLECFVRNGRGATMSRWTPPPPPARPLFQSSQPTHGFHSSGSNSKHDFPAFGYSSQPQSKSLFGSSAATVSGGGFAFGSTTNASTSSSFGFGSATSGFGGKSTSSFGSSGSNGVGSGFGGSGVVFGSSGNTGKPPLAPSSNLFATSTSSFSKKSTSNPFATKPANPFATSTTSPFRESKAFSFGDSMAKQSGTSTGNPFAVKNASSSTSNPFAMKQTLGSTSNPFAVKQAPSSNANPFAAPFLSSSSANPLAARVSPNATVNPFSAATVDSSTSNKNGTNGSSPVWPPGKTSWSSSSNAGSASLKFKSGLRPAFYPSASCWSTSTKELTSTQPAAITSFDWTGWEKSNAERTISVGEATQASTTEFSAQSEGLVASPDTNPYGSGSFGAGLVEQKVKEAIAIPPSSIELKILDAGSLFASPAPTSRQQPSASSFARLAISKRAVRIHVNPSAMPVKSDSSSPGKTEPVHSAHESVGAASLAKSDVKSDNEPEPATVRHESDEDDNQVEKYASPSACPVLLSDKYFTEPSVSDLQQLTEEELARVENFVIGRHGCGKISFVGATDLRGLQLDDLVVFTDREVVVYPDEDAKPDVGCALNKPAIVYLQGISAEVNELQEDFLKRLESHTQALGATFLGYDEDSQAGNGGVWSFRVKHF